MRRTFRFLWLTVLPMMLGLASCSIDNPVEPVNPNPIEDITLDDFNKLLTATPYVDISYYMMEENTIRVWAFNEDKTFVAYDLFTDDEVGSFQVKESTGRWNAFIDAKNEWEEDNTDKLVGFDAEKVELAPAPKKASKKKPVEEPTNLVFERKKVEVKPAIVF